jgi:hypothetical protein
MPDNGCRPTPRYTLKDVRDFVHNGEWKYSEADQYLLTFYGLSVDAVRQVVSEGITDMTKLHRPGRTSRKVA